MSPRAWSLTSSATTASQFLCQFVLVLHRHYELVARAEAPALAISVFVLCTTSNSPFRIFHAICCRETAAFLAVVLTLVWDALIAEIPVVSYDWLSATGDVAGFTEVHRTGGFAIGHHSNLFSIQLAPASSRPSGRPNRSTSQASSCTPEAACGLA